MNKKNIILLFSQTLLLVLAVYVYRLILKVKDIGDSLIILAYISVGASLVFLSGKICQVLFIASWWRYIKYLIFILYLSYYPTLFYDVFNFFQSRISNVSNGSNIIIQYGYVLFLILYAYYFVLITVLIKIEIKKKQTDHGKDINNTRNAIEEASQDLLGRKEEVENFYLNILKNERQNRTAGIIGPWGAGKTSFINMLKEYKRNENKSSEQSKGGACIKDSRDLIFVDYNFYHQEHISGRDKKYTYLYIFSLFLGVALKGCGIDDEKIIIFFQELAHFSFVSSLPNKYGIDFTDYILRSFDDIKKDICDELKSLLINNNKRIIVIYDDFDRLTERSEIFEVLKLIDIVNSINSPKIFQIVAYDDEKLLYNMRMEKEKKEEDEFNQEFLDRMIDYKFLLRDAISYPLRKFLQKDDMDARQLTELYKTEANQALQKAANSVRSITMREAIDCDISLYQAIKTIIHYIQRTSKESVSEDGSNEPHNETSNESANDTLITINGIKESRSVSVMQSQKAFFSLTNIKILRLTQLMKTFSLDDYKRVRDSFRFKKFRTKRRDGTFEKTEDEDTIKIDSLSSRNRAIFDALEEFFSNALKHNRPSGDNTQYEKIIQYHFPELLDAVLILIEKILNQFYSSCAKQISDDLRDEIRDQGFFNILDECLIKDKKVVKMQDGKSIITWKDFKEASKSSIDKESLDRFLRLYGSVQKSAFSNSKFEVQNYGLLVHVSRLLYNAHSESIKDYTKKEIQCEPYRTGFYVLLYHVATDSDYKNLYAEWVNWFVESLYSLIIKGDNAVIAERLEKDNGYFLYYLLSSFLRAFSDDKENENGPLDEKLAYCIIQSKDKIKILANLLYATLGEPRSDDPEYYEQSKNYIFIDKKSYLIKDIENFQEIHKLLHDDECWKVLEKMYNKNNYSSSNKVKSLLKYGKDWILYKDQKK